MVCIHCQKEIEDGAVFCPFCGGKQDVDSGKSAGTGLGADLAEIFKGIFTSPKEVLKTTFNKSNVILALIFIGVQSLFSGLMLLAFMKKALKSLGLYMGSVNAKMFFLGFLGGAGINCLMALFLFVFLGKMSKKDIGFQNALSAVGMKALANIPFLILACIGGLIAPWLGVVFAISGMILGYVYLYTAVPEDDSNTVNPVYGKYFSSLCTVLSSMLWIYLLIKLFS